MSDVGQEETAKLPSSARTAIGQTNNKLRQRQCLNKPKCFAPNGRSSSLRLVIHLRREAIRRYEGNPWRAIVSIWSQKRSSSLGVV
jgi:hypothetical protein